MNEDSTSPTTTSPHVPGWLRTSASYGWRILILFAIAAIAFLLFRQLKILIIGIILGYLESVALWPLVRWMRAHRINKVAAALIAVAVAVAILVLFFVLMIREFAGQASELASAAASGGDEIRRGLADISNMDPEAAQRVFSSISDLLKQLGSFLGSGILGALAFLGQVVTIFFLAQFLAIYFLADWETLWGWTLGHRPIERRSAWDRAGRAGTSTIAAWLRAQTLIALFDATFIGLGVYLLDVPLAGPIALLTFVLAYIPLIGATISGAVAVLVALGANGWPTALAVLAVVIVVQQLEGNILGPLLTARAVRFHPVATFVMMAAAGALFGVFGMFFAVPIAGAIVAMRKELFPSAASGAEPSPEGGTAPSTSPATASG
jgi:predicted PurR-regulated permease PerM